MQDIEEMKERMIQERIDQRRIKELRWAIKKTKQIIDNAGPYNMRTAISTLLIQPIVSFALLYILSSFVSKTGDAAYDEMYCHELENHRVGGLALFIALIVPIVAEIFVQKLSVLNAQHHSFGEGVPAEESIFDQATEDQIETLELELKNLIKEQNKVTAFAVNLSVIGWIPEYIGMAALSATFRANRSTIIDAHFDIMTFRQFIIFLIASQHGMNDLKIMEQRLHPWPLTDFVLRGMYKTKMADQFALMDLETQAAANAEQPETVPTREELEERIDKYVRKVEWPDESVEWPDESNANVSSAQSDILLNPGIKTVGFMGTSNFDGDGSKQRGSSSVSIPFTLRIRFGSASQENPKLISMGVYGKL